MAEAMRLSPHAFIDALAVEEARGVLRTCCGAARWVEGMLERRPYGSSQALFEAAETVWSALGREDILEAFGHHPEIGGDLARLREKYAASAKLSEGEQAGVAAADEATLVALQGGNRTYKERFGYIFIVCATGKSAREMLDLLTARLSNPSETELRVAAGEQSKITRIRLEKLAR